MVTMVNPQLTYVEGVSFFPHTRLIGAHAWCVDPDGYVIDPTDTLPSYFGVPLNVAWIAKTLERAGTAASALRFLFENGETVRGDFLDARWAEWKLGTLQRRFRTLGA